MLKNHVKFIDSEWTDALFKEMCAFPLVPHDDWTDSTVWLLTYFMFHLEGSANRVNAFAGQQRGVQRAITKEFTETKPRHDHRGRRTMFNDLASETYRFGTEDRSKLRRSGDLKFDTDM